jgi:hypothetical protein
MNRFVKALEAKYQAKIEEALAVIDLYLNKAVGVGEHPDIMEVLDQNIAILESNKSKLETLKSLFSPVTEDAVEKQSDK